MKKNKKGQIVASLTEVKNKTGDIFAVVDQYGEIILTSYNKPRYIIKKIDFEANIQIEEESQEEKKIQKKDSQKTKTKPKNTVSTTKDDDDVALLKNLTPWSSNSKIELDFIENILQPIQ
jgi:hypothetical protein